MARLGAVAEAHPLGRRLALALVVLDAASVGAWRLGALGAAGDRDEARALRSSGDLLAYVRAHPDRASLVVLRGPSGERDLFIAGDVRRPTPGLTALLLAAGWSRQQAAGSGEIVGALPTAALRAYALPGLDDPPGDTAAVPLAALARRALRGDRIAADALLEALGRGAVDALPRRLGAGDLDAPVPVGGLVLAWAPAERAGTPDAQARAFLALDAASRRDSAYDRARAYLTSPAYRAAELARRAPGGLGLRPDLQRALAAATLPAGTALGYARLLLAIGRGPGADPTARLLLDDDGTGFVSGRAPGIVAAAFVDRGLSPRGATAVVLLIQGLSEAEAVRFSDAAAVRQVLAEWAAPGSD